MTNIFYSKADQTLGKQTRTFVGQKKILERRALMQERPTIIFTTPAALQQFLQHLPQTQAWRQLPDVCLGYATDAILPPTTPSLVANGFPVTPDEYATTSPHAPLDLITPSPPQLAQQTSHVPHYAPRLCFQMSFQLLKMAQKQLDPDNL